MCLLQIHILNSLCHRIIRRTGWGSICGVSYWKGGVGQYDRLLFPMWPWSRKVLFCVICANTALWGCVYVRVMLVSQAKGAWAWGVAENLSPSCQAAFKVFSSCSSGCSQPRPHPCVSCCYVTVPAGRTKGEHGDSDRHWMIQGREQKE